MTRHADPRRAGGDIAGPGGPHDRDAVVVDVTDAVLLDYTEVTLIRTGRRSPLGPALDPEPAIGLLLAGRINKTHERAEILYLLNTDGAAAIVTELLALADRVGPGFAEDFARRTIALAEAGHAEHKPEGPTP